ncbi:hypothetical protein [uncultured Maribacter sp.]|uniref:hypothetical protein n=1 Tax=uncultured Maribacter sp. TaxID=431308 RepID=UPI0026298A4C|nr:hypothetical protein [uncultured Maribacter sp.]
MDKQDFNLLINILRFAFDLYKNPKQVKSLLLTVWKYLPLVFVFAMVFLFFVMLALSPLAFNKGETLWGAYGNFILFLVLALGALPFAKFFYQDFKITKKPQL